MRKRKNLAKIGNLCLALVVALGVMGVAYSAWSDTLDINATVETGIVNAALDCGYCSENVSCQETGDYELEVTVTDAQFGIDYSCEFDINNNIGGTIPVKVKSIVLSGVPGGVITNKTGEGTVIDPGVKAIGGTVYVALAEGYTGPTTFSFYVTVTIVRWNEQ